MRKELWKRLLSLALAFALCAGLAMPAAATGNDADWTVEFEKVDNAEAAEKNSDLKFEPAVDEPAYKDDEIVRVSIVLEQMSTVAKFDTVEIIGNAAAQAYRDQLKNTQKSMAQTISQTALGGQELDVVWNLTFAANIISANVRYDQIEAIAAVDGVADVVIETKYEPMVVNGSETVSPNMATSSVQIGVNGAYAAGYTGAGSKIAIIDTGLDMDHQSFAADSFLYSLEQEGAEVDLMTADDLTSDVLAQLNVSATAAQLYRNAKVPFGYNYVDVDLDITHDNDGQGGHGSHVAGIAAANNYIAVEDGYDLALNTVATQGVAPNAQLIVMKVFGKAGGAYDSDYMAAIEDALVLGADSVNLSLGSGNPGMSRAGDTYQRIMDGLVDAGAVVAMSAGNSGYWAESAYYPYLYDDGVSFQTDGSPGSYTNALTVASVDNDGTTGAYFTVGGYPVFYSESLVGNDGTPYNNVSITTLAGAQEFIYVDNTGADADGNSLLADYADVIAGKIVFCNRGDSSFYQKAEAAVEAGAIATVICNNQDGIINMDLSDYSYTAPAVSITLYDAEAVKYFATAVTDDAGNVLYYTGTMNIGSGVGYINYDSDYYTMSSFSSWGVPGSLELKPEITAPGGLIYSVDGEIAGGKSYVTMSGTSMASPQVAGMAALVQQYIREEGLATGKAARHLAQSLLMSTAVPMIEADSGSFYSVLNQGAGLANVGAAINADSYITMHANATDSYADGKVKAELGDDPAKNGVYNFGFTINNLTGEDKEYALGADMFTQDLYPAAPGLTFHDTWTRPLMAAVTFVVDGKVLNSTENLTNMDFNGDKVVDVKDCVALLDYTTGKLDTLYNEEYADIDADGNINSYDAYLFLQQYNNGVVTLPADGSVNVSVTIDLMENLSNYPVGAYVEGFINVDGMPDAEGVLGTAHSIPVLGFYGNWSDASMYDVGGYWEVATGEETRYPYLFLNLGAEDEEGREYMSNMLTVDYADGSGEYIFGGNPYDVDEYIPERAAFNNVNGDAMTWYFTLIRNAAASKFSASVNGTVLDEGELGPVYSAYYYVNGGYWNNTQLSLALNSFLAGAKENDVVDVALTMAPEYYVSNDGTVNWDALGDGATMTESFVIDNTAPEMISAVYDADTKIMTIKAKDNQYISTLVVGNTADNTLVAKFGSDADAAANTEIVYEIDLTDVDAETAKLMLYVNDYACNYAAYRIALVEPGDAVINSIALNKTSLKMVKGTSATLEISDVESWGVEDTYIWTSSDETVATVNENGKVTALAKGECVITATASSNPEATASCDVSVITFETTLHGTLMDEDSNSLMYTWDLANDSTWTATAQMDLSMTSATYNFDDNYLYVNDGDAGSWGMHEVSMIGDTVASYPNTAGVPLWDMEYSWFSAMAGAPMINGIYGPYLLPFKDPAAMNASAYNLSSLLGGVSGGQILTAITSLGVAPFDTNGDGTADTYAEELLVLDDAGMIWAFFYCPDGSLYYNTYPTDLPKLKYGGINKDQLGSMAATVEDDALVLYLSYFNGSTNEIYRMELNNTDVFESTYIGDFGDGVWPATIYLASPNNASANSVNLAEAAAVLSAAANRVDVDEIYTEDIFGEDAADTTEPEVEATEPEAPVVEATEPVVSDVEPTEPETTQQVAGNLNSVANYTGAASPDSAAREDEGTVTVNVTADEAAPNGKFTVLYDPEVLTYVSTSVNADYYSVNAAEGEVVFAYAQLDNIAAGDVIATVTFTAASEEETVVTVFNDELGKDLPGTGESLPVGGSADEGAFLRVYGETRYQTSFKTADALKEVLGVEKFENVIVTSGEGYYDALSGSYLATKKNAPILLVKNTNMGEVKGYIRANLAPGGTVYILGGTGVVGTYMEEGLDEFTVKRLGGLDRYATNLAILNEAGIDGEDLLICSTLGYADSLSASASGKPILIVNDGLLPAQKEFLDANYTGEKVYVIGGTGVISTYVENQVAAYGDVTRLGGANRFETSVAVAKEFYPNPKLAVLAYGYGFADGLCAGPLAVNLGAPLVLADSGEFVSIPQAYLSGKAIGGVVLGGPTMVTDKVVRTIFGLADDVEILIY